MGIHDGVPERRNLIVMSLAIIIYYWAGGSIPEADARLLIVTVHFDKQGMLFGFVWILFIYFIFRYWVTSKGFSQDSIRKKMGTELHQLSIRKKHYSYLFDEFKKSNQNVTLTYADLVNWYIIYNQSKTIFSGVAANNTSRTMSIKGIRSHLILFETLIRGYLNFPSVNAYYTPYILSFVAFLTLGCNTCLKFYN